MDPCPACGAARPKESQFCPHCGAGSVNPPVPSAPAAPTSDSVPPANGRSRPRPVVIACIVVGVILLGAGVTAALSSGGSSPARGLSEGSSTSSTTSALPITGALVPPALPPSRTDLADGRHAAYIKSLNLNEMTLTVDVIQFLTGEDANREVRKHGQEYADDDYVILNPDAKLRTLTLSPSVSTFVNVPNGSDLQMVAIGSFAEELYGKTFESTESHEPFWLSIENGEITRIEQQFIP